MSLAILGLQTLLRAGLPGSGGLLKRALCMKHGTLRQQQATSESSARMRTSRLASKMPLAGEKTRPLALPTACDGMGPVGHPSRPARPLAHTRTDMRYLRLRRRRVLCHRIWGPSRRCGRAAQ
ncbi:hypothetical protein F5144DRAFT_581619 [Chaetomium tenue]|uniref:Uncharacterized protein n=1 Tax=Chaetomium tenue TaxID=1854479 RepID=A0ACB7NXE2_9PEZI|nr:hypothetical protein F5144DRAFT_581619 [Chaetomium globosum]